MHFAYAGFLCFFTVLYFWVNEEICKNYFGILGHKYNEIISGFSIGARVRKNKNYIKWHFRKCL